MAKGLYCVGSGRAVTGLGPGARGARRPGRRVDSVHQIELFPGPTAMPSGADLLVGSGYWVMFPLVVIRPRTLAVFSVNQRLPSGPATMSKGQRPAMPSENSEITPLVVIRPILLEPFSVNQRLPSGPRAMPQGMANLVGTANSVIEPPVVIRAIRSPDRLGDPEVAVRAGGDPHRPAAGAEAHRS